MPRPINHDDTRCALCDCLGIQHDGPEHGGPCTTPDGHGGRCECPGFEVPMEDDDDDY